MTLSVGDEAPDFDVDAVVAPEAGGAVTTTRLRLGDYRGKKNVVLYFYPKDFTPVCTKEACGFRDVYDELRGQDTEVIGVSVDAGADHERFVKKLGLTFPLVADPGRDLAKKYGATGVLSSILGRTSRVTFLIDKQGKIAAVLKAELSADTHVSGVREALARLAT